MHTIAVALEKFRCDLQKCISSPIDIAMHREDLVRDLSALQCCGDDELPRLATCRLRELKETQKRLVELEKECIDVKQLENKMQYSIKVKEVEIAKNRAAELSKELNHLLRTSDIVVQNQKRVIIEVERLDTIAYKVIKDLPDLSTLEQSTLSFTPLRSAREKSLEAMKSVTKELEETRSAMNEEQIEHRHKVEKLKREIKYIKADISSIIDGKHSMQTTFETYVIAKEGRVNDMKAKRQARQDEIEMIKVEISEDQLVHNANMIALENHRALLARQLKVARDETVVAISDLEAQLSELKQEQSDVGSVLETLEQRLCDERTKNKEIQEVERLHAEKKAEAKAREEKEHFAALWIQLRWKAYLRRQSKKAATKGKKKDGKKKSKR